MQIVDDHFGHFAQKLRANLFQQLWCDCSIYYYTLFGGVIQIFQNYSFSVLVGWQRPTS